MSIEFKNKVIYTENIQELRAAFEKYCPDRTSALVWDQYHDSKHRVPKFMKKGAYVRWMNCNERICGYRLLYSRRKNKKDNVWSEWSLDLFYFVLSNPEYK